MRRMMHDYRQTMWRIAITLLAMGTIPEGASAQCASGSGLGSSGGGAMMQGGGMPRGGGARMAFAMQMMQMQAQMQAQMQEMMRRQMMEQMGGCNKSQEENVFVAGTADRSFGQTRVAASPPTGPLTDCQQRQLAREEEHQSEIENRIAERDGRSAERLAAWQQQRATLRARHVAE